MSLVPDAIQTVTDFLALCEHMDRMQRSWEQRTGTPWPSLEEQCDVRERMERGDFSPEGSE